MDIWSMTMKRFEVFMRNDKIHNPRESINPRLVL